MILRAQKSITQIEWLTLQILLGLHAGVIFHVVAFQIFHNTKFAKTQVAFKLEESGLVNKMSLQVDVPRETLVTIRTAVQVTATMQAFVQAQSAGSEHSLRTYRTLVDFLSSADKAARGMLGRCSLCLQEHNRQISPCLHFSSQMYIFSLMQLVADAANKAYRQKIWHCTQTFKSWHYELDVCWTSLGGTSITSNEAQVNKCSFI